MSKLARSQLTGLSVKALREYVKAFNLPADNVIEKTDLVNVIMAHRPLEDHREVYFRNHIPIAEPSNVLNTTLDGDHVGDGETAGHRSQAASNRRTRRVSTRSCTPPGTSARRSSTFTGRAFSRQLRRSHQEHNYHDHQHFRQHYEQHYHHHYHHEPSASTPFLISPLFDNVFEFWNQFFDTRSSPNSSSLSTESIPSYGHSTLQPLYAPSLHVPHSSSSPNSNGPYFAGSSPPNFNPSSWSSHDSHHSNTEMGHRQGSHFHPSAGTVHREGFDPIHERQSPSPAASWQNSADDRAMGGTHSAGTNQDGPPSIHNIMKNKLNVSTFSVKTLKGILNDNCVDFAGIVEKSELVQKVNRLIEHSRKEYATDVDSLSDDALCKICCDAPQNCVIMDCGHMSTCMECGKKLQETRNECPICRETIVKLIRVFRS